MMANVASHGRRSKSIVSTAHKDAPRPVSRASTTSIQSFDQRPPVALQRRQSQLHNHFTMHEGQKHDAQQQNSMRDIEAAVMLLRSNEPEQHGQHMSVDPSLQLFNQAPDNNMVMQQHVQQFNVPLNDYGSTYNSGAFETAVAIHPAAQRLMQEPEEKKKKGASSTATNDRELRSMLAQNEARTLKDVANEVNKTERTPRSERSKQLFAMLWLRAVCKKAKTSVPRNRVYSHYQTRCGTERVQPLNPASFGKLVRVIFPGIQTRRLGVRGESKYHYVELALVDDDEDSNESEKGPNGLSRKNSMSQPPMGQNSYANQQSDLPVDTAVFPSHDQILDSPAFESHAEFSSSNRLFSNPGGPWTERSGPTSRMYRQHLKFHIPDDTTNDIHSIELPNIHDYAPPKTDIDAANALLACYRTHCTSLIDCIRFCKEKQFFRLFSSFNGNLTVPVQKLFVHPDVAPWIKECDWLMYQKMIRCVANLALTVVPEPVVKFLESVTKNLHAHISKVFQVNPAHVLEARLEPATHFANLLRRMLRTNTTAHAAAHLLIMPDIVEQMWGDWTSKINPKRLMEGVLPGCGYDEAYRIITTDVRQILQPSNAPIPPSENAHFYQQDYMNFAFDTLDASDTVIERIAHFIKRLPSRFPQANARLILSCLSQATTAACQEITMEKGFSFHSWWNTKMFIDEYAAWIASLGGFLDHTVPAHGTQSQRQFELDLGLERSLSNEESGSRQGSRYTSLGPNFSTTDGFGDAAFNSRPGTSASQMNHAPFVPSGLQSQIGDEHDDSGIGMGMLDDDGAHAHHKGFFDHHQQVQNGFVGQQVGGLR